MSTTDVRKDLADRLKIAAKYVYWTIGLIIIGGISYILYNKLERQISAILFFIAGILALYFYYVKWFIIPNTKKNWEDASICPDYLTLIPSASSGTKHKCLDFVGVSRNKALKVSEHASIQPSLSDPSRAFTIDTSEDIDSLRQRVNSMGLTWISLLGND